MIRRPPRSTRTDTLFPYTTLFRSVSALPVTNAMSEKLRLQEPIRSPLETPRLITPLPYRSGTSFLAWAIVNNNQPVPDVFSKMTKIAASGRLGQTARRYTRNAGAGGFQRARPPKENPYPTTNRKSAG